MAANNFNYDELGQLISDASENIQNIEWRKGDKKIKKMVRNGANGESELEFKYNPFGQRVLKINRPRVSGALSPQSQWKYTYYTYDANGQVMAVYDVKMSATFNSAVLEEQHLYGASRLGMLKQDLTVYDPYPEGIESTAIYANKVGQTYFEINNYLGNVNAVITDRKSANLIPSASNASTREAVVMNTSDYYPFGMVMPGRSTSYSSVDYRYGYSGMEMDNEVSGQGNSYSTEFRQYDPRLGRWKSLDPLKKKYPSMSPYVAFNNNPIFFNDPFGLEGEEPKGESDGGGKQDFTYKCNSCGNNPSLRERHSENFGGSSETDGGDMSEAVRGPAGTKDLPETSWEMREWKGNTQSGKWNPKVNTFLNNHPEDKYKLDAIMRYAQKMGPVIQDHWPLQSEQGNNIIVEVTTEDGGGFAFSLDMNYVTSKGANVNVRVPLYVIYQKSSVDPETTIERVTWDQIIGQYAQCYADALGIVGIVDDPDMIIKDDYQSSVMKTGAVGYSKDKGHMLKIIGIKNGEFIFKSNWNNQSPQTGTWKELQQGQFRDNGKEDWKTTDFNWYEKK